MLYIAVRKVARVVHLRAVALSITLPYSIDDSASTSLSISAIHVSLYLSQSLTRQNVSR